MYFVCYDVDMVFEVVMKMVYFVEDDARDGVGFVRVL